MKVTEVLIAVEPLADFVADIPLAGGALSTLLRAAIAVCKVVQEIDANSDALEALAIEEALLSVAIAKAMQGISDSECKMHMAPLEDLISVLNDTRAYIMMLKDKYRPSTDGSSMRRLLRKGRLTVQNALNVQQDAGERMQLEVRVANAVKRFGVAAAIEQLKQQSNLAEIVSGISTAVSDIRVAQQQAERLAAMRWLATQLKRVDEALFNSATAPQGCFDDTRITLFEEIDKWAATEGAPQVLWMSGPAGTGKSAVSRTTCERFYKKGLLLASFFFSRNFTLQRSPEAFLHTLVFYCAQKYPQFFTHVHDTLAEHPNTTSLPLSEQVEKLFLAPLKAVGAAASDGPLYIVIDAFDECDGQDGREGASLLPSLLNVVREFPLPLRLFIASREDKTIADVFAREGGHATIKLHDIHKDVVKQDIRTIYRRRFREIVAARGLRGLEKWPSEAEIELLVEMAGFLFVYAATVARFVDHPIISPVERLRIVLQCGSQSHPSSGPSSSPFRLLDALYVQILEHAIGDEQDDDDYLKSRVRTVVAALVLVQDPLTLPALSRLISGDPFEEPTTVAIVQRMSAILVYSETEPIRLFHPSFPDFVLRRCNDARFQITPAERHGDLVLRSFAIMNQGLQKNICGIDDPTVPNWEVPDLPRRVVENIGEELWYASRHWLTHLTLASPSAALSSELASFAKTRLLHWIEALSLMGVLRVAVVGLSSAAAWLLGHADTETQTLLRDADRMVQANFDLISTTTLQVYHAAITFMPNCALYRQATEESLSRIRLLSPRPRGWSPLLNALTGHKNKIAHVAFMSDNVRLVTGSWDGSARIWNTRTLECVATFAGPHKKVLAVALSPDEKLLASCGEPAGVAIWDLDTGTVLRVLEGQRDAQACVAFSADGSRVGVGSHDETACVWDVGTGERVSTMKGHTYWVTSLAFSKDGQRMATGSIDDTLKIWDVATGALMHDVRARTESVAFSPDGLRLLTGMLGDDAIGVLDAETGRTVQMIQGHENHVISAEYTPDGSRIVSSSPDHTIRKWDADSGECLAVFNIPHECLGPLVISADETRIASVSANAIEVWDAQALLLRDTANAQVETGPVRKVVFAPDGVVFAWASSSGTVRLTRTKTGEDIHTIPHSCAVDALLFSPDGGILAVGSLDGIVRLFDTRSWQQIGVLEWPSEDERSRGGAVALAFSQDGSRIACSAHSILRGTDSVHVWDAATREHVASLQTDGSDGALAFSRDKKWIVAGSAGGERTQVWDVGSGERVATLPSYTPHLQSLAFTPGSLGVVSRCSDGTVVVTDLIPEDQDQPPPAPETEIDDAPPRFSWQSRVDSRSWLYYSPGAGREAKPICWFPKERRPYRDPYKRASHCYAWHGDVVAVGSENGFVTVLDLSEAILAL